jgi:hypothetical protein
MPARLPAIPFVEHCCAVEQHLECAYNIRIRTVDVPDPLTGDLDGAEIHLDFALTPEQRLFLLAHLFGHTVQWNVSPKAFDIGKLHEPPVSEKLLREIMDYERDAARYAMGMLHDIGITDADQWLSDYTACDMSYLRHYYRTGEKRSFRSFWRDHSVRIEPLMIPVFRPAKRIFRRDGVVI